MIPKGLEKNGGGDLDDRNYRNCYKHSHDSKEISSNGDSNQDQQGMEANGFCNDGWLGEHIVHQLLFFKSLE